MDRVIKQQMLVNKDKTGKVKHNKFYKVSLIRDSYNFYHIRTNWGSIGSQNQGEQTKLAGNELSGKKEFRKILIAKRKRGYRLI